MAERVVVTGGTGFLGRHLSARLARDGWDTVAVTDLDEKLEGIETVKANVLDAGAISPIIEAADVVVHLAAITEHDAIVNRPFETLELNHTGTRNVLQSFTQGKGRLFIFPSTGKVYGKPEYLPYDEEHPARPSNVLGKSKLIAERLVDFYSTFSDKAFSVLRIFNVYGTGQKETFLIPTIISQLGSPKVVLGDLDPTRDYIYIDDVVDAFVAVMNKAGPGMSVYNVGIGRSYSPRDIIRMFEKIEGIECTVETDPSRHRSDEFDDERADTARLERLGWEGRTEMETGLRKTLETWKKV